MIKYLTRIPFEVPGGSIVVEVECQGAVMPTSGKWAINMMGKPMIFEIDYPIFYANVDAGPVVLTKPYRVSALDLAYAFVTGIQNACDDEWMIFRKCEEILAPEGNSGT